MNAHIVISMNAHIVISMNAHIVIRMNAHICKFWEYQCCTQPLSV